MVAITTKETVKGAKAAPKAPEELKRAEPTAPVEEEKISLVHTYKCTSCPGAWFEDITLHRAHFKSEWHRANLKLKMASLTLLMSDEFENLTDKAREEILSRVST